ncbi:MAG: prenyltransferase [Planctomycetota bacterium]
MKIRLWIRALRLPFLTASLLPYLFGTLKAQGGMRWTPFLLGLLAVGGTHLSANLMNDYADSQSGVDWRDPTYYGFFGGSKLIQEGVFSPRFYLGLATGVAVLSFLAALALAWILKRPIVPVFYLLILFLAWSYSQGPFRLSYRRLGELTVFLLFGPAAVVGGAFLQLGRFPPLPALFASLPFGFLTAAILTANELPDAPEDLQGGKRTLVGWMGPSRGFLLYAGLVSCAYLCLFALLAFGRWNRLALFAFAAAPLGFRAAGILRTQYRRKEVLVRASKLTVALHTIVGLSMILGLQP